LTFASRNDGTVPLKGGLALAAIHYGGRHYQFPSINSTAIASALLLRVLTANAMALAQFLGGRALAPLLSELGHTE
jgi:hypothetical protein